MKSPTRRARAAIGTLAAVALATTVLTAAPAHAAPQQVRVVTVNIDFGNSAQQVKEDFDIYAPEADVILMQEAKNVDLDALIGPSWVVRQFGGDDEAKKGSAIVVRRSILKENADGTTAGSVSDLNLVKLHDGGTWGSGSSTCTIMTRYLAHVTIKLANGGDMRVASLHLPPGYCDAVRPALYDAAATEVVKLSDTYPKHLLLGADWNKVVRSDPRNISGRTNERIVPRAPEGDIDGFYLPNTLDPIGAVEELEPNTNPPDGHRPVRAVVSIPAVW